MDLVITAVYVGLVWATFSRPRRLWSLITLSVCIAVECYAGIRTYLALASPAASPGVPILVTEAGVCILVVGVIMAWIAVAKARP